MPASELFQQQLAGTIGTRTKLLAKEVVFKTLLDSGIDEGSAADWSKQIAAIYGKLKTEKDKPFEIEQLVHIAPDELVTLTNLVKVIAKENRAPTSEELDALLHEQTAVDIAMFGRMLASKQGHNCEAAVQVAHAIGVHASAIEEDYFTAVDDLNRTDSSAAHVDQAGFAAAVFYQYICIDRDLLKRNLGDDEALTQKALRALVEAAVKVGPSGKQNSFASRAYAHYVMAEKGSQQPRSLSLAFVKPVSSGDYGSEAIEILERVRDNMDKVYGACADERKQLNALVGEGSMLEILDFVASE